MVSVSLLVGGVAACGRVFCLEGNTDEGPSSRHPPAAAGN